jgi:multiple sugar transport system substrate-binding protein
MRRHVRRFGRFHAVKAKIALSLLLTLTVFLGVAGAAEVFDWRQAEGQSIKVLYREDVITAEFVKHHEEFERLTGISVEVDFMGREGWSERMAVQMLAGTPDLDLVHLHDFDVPILVGAGALEPLDRFLDDPSTTPRYYSIDVYPDHAIESGLMDGGIYYIPTSVNPIMYFYRSDVFEELGLEPAQDYDQFLENARRTTQALNPDSPTLYGNMILGRLPGEHIFQSWSNLFLPLGGEYVDIEAQEVLVDSDAGVQALERLKLYVDEELVPPDWSSISTPEATDYLARGLVAQLISAPDLRPRIASIPDGITSEQLGGAVNPGWIVDGELVGQGAAITITTGFSMSAFSENKDAAWLYIMFQTLKEDTYYKSIQAGTIMSARSHLYIEDPDMRALRGSDAEILGRAGILGRTTPPLPGWTQAQVALNEEIQAALIGEKSVESALSDAKARMTRALGW